MGSQGMARDKGRIMCGAKGLGVEGLGFSRRCLPSSTHLYACREPHACALTNLSRAGKKPPPPKSVVQVNEGFTLLCGLSPNTFLPHSPTLTPGFHPHLREAGARKETHEEDLFVGFGVPGSGLGVTVGSQVLLRRRSRVRGLSGMGIVDRGAN